MALAGASALALMLSLGTAAAQTVVVPDGATVGQQSLDDGETLLVEPGGTVSDPGPAVIDAVDGTTVNVDNAGTIESNTFAVDTIGSDLNLINRATGTIEGDLTAIVGSTIGSLTNSGDIVGLGGFGISANNLQSLTNTAGGLIQGGSGGITAFDIGSLTNGGTITGADTGISVSGTISSLTNNAGALIRGGDYGLDVDGDIGSLTNGGAIIGTATYGIDSVYIQSLTNTAGGLIQGGETGLSGEIGSLTNGGAIVGTLYSGIDAFNVQSLTNTAGGLIRGGTDGLYAAYAGGGIQSLTNSGAIIGMAGDGIFATDIQSLTNTAGGLIQGANTGILSVGGTVGSLTNSGEIIGTADVGINASQIQSLTNTAGGLVQGGLRGIAAGDIGSLTNSGDIVGIANVGVSAGTIQSLTNTAGALIRGGEDGLDVDVDGDIGSLTNGGAIVGTLYSGIDAANIQSLTNTAGGLIQGGENGLYVDDIVSLTNGGAIVGTANAGIDAGDIQSLTNTAGGRIEGGERGIYVVDGIQSLTNSGAIIGTANTGIEADEIHSLTNSGLISGGSFAIHEFGSADTQLTLLQGSVLIGAVGLGGAATQNTLNIGPGLSLDSVFTSSGAFALGETHGAPYAVTALGGNQYQVALADQTALFAHDEMLVDLTDGIFGALGGHLEESHGPSRPLAYAADPAPQTAIYARREPLARQYWLKGFGAFRDQDGGSSTAASDQVVGGVLSGVDVWTGHDRRAGFFAGGSWAEAEVASSQTVETVSGFGGVYATLAAGDGILDLAFAAGYSAFDSERRIANNNAPNGIETAEAEYEGFFVSPHAKFTQPLGVFEASASVRYAGLFLDGYTETGATNNLTVDDRDVHLGVARGALSLPTVFSGAMGELRTTLTGGIEARAQFGDGDATGTLLGQTLVFDGDDEEAIGGFAGVKAEHWTAGGTLLFAESEGLIEDDGSVRFFARGGVKAQF